MKKIPLLLFALLFSITCMSQQVSKVIDFKLPNGAQKLIQKQEVETFSTGTNTSSVVRKGMDYYSIDSIKIGFLDNYATKDFQKPLENIIKSIKYDRDDRTRTNITAFIKTFNNMRFLIYGYDENGISFLRFYSDFYNNHAVSGLVQFNKADTQKATKILYDMLNTAKFKD